MKFTGYLLAVWSLLALAACSGTPERRAEVQDTRDSYIEYAENRLDAWEDRADDMENELRKGELNAYIRDTRAELNAMKSAPEATWRNYRARVDAGLGQMTTNFGVAE